MDDLAHDITIAADLFVPLTAYKPKKEFFDVVAPLLPPTWRLLADHFWTYAWSPQPGERVQGWKIHVSTTHEAALRTLAVVVGLCLAHRTEFKFASDRYILKKLLSKSALRSAGGKFITIYPADEQRFRTLIEALHDALAGERGPYILSDRAYRDSEVVFYRYGGFKSFSHVSVLGHTRSNIISREFSYVEDVRGASFHLPDGVVDPFCAPEPELAPEPDAAEQGGSGASVLLHERFQCLEALKFSNAGGVYIALDMQTGQQVIVKEARPHIGQDAQGDDAIRRLKKEYEILAALQAEGIAPRPLAYFQEWNHFYFAQDFVRGKLLRKFFVGANRLFHPGTDADGMSRWFARATGVAADIVDLVRRLHRHDVIFGDLSLNNIIIDDDTLRPMLIDFEGSYRAGLDRPVNMFTPGFADSSRHGRKCTVLADDYYALGMIVFSVVCPHPPLQDIKPGYARELLADLRARFDVPAAYCELVLALLGHEPVDLAQAASVLRALAGCRLRGFDLAPALPDYREDCAQAARRLVAGTAARLDLAQPDGGMALGEGFRQIMSIDFGMLGVAYASWKVTGGLPDGLEAFLKARVHGAGQLPGLLNGLAGVAWVASELAWHDVAAAALAHAGMHRQLYEHYSLGYGAAGCGLANLRAWQRTGSAACLDEALRIGAALLANAVHGDGTCHWPSAVDRNGQPVGLYEGSSGIALYLLYLHAVCGDQRLLELGERALAFDLARQGSLDDVVGYPRQINPAVRILYPYLAYGSAGVASVAIRYFLVTGKSEYRDVVAQVVNGVAQKYSIAPGVFTGLSGLGSFLKDAIDLLDMRACEPLLARLVDGLKLFEIPQPVGTAVPGVRPTKICSDYANGASGVALFLHWVGGASANPNFFPDELLAGAARSASLETACCATAGGAPC